MDYDRDKVDEMVLALLWLKPAGDGRAWKGHDWEAWCLRFASFVWTLTWVREGPNASARLAQKKGEPGAPGNVDQLEGVQHLQKTQTGRGGYRISDQKSKQNIDNANKKIRRLADVEDQ